MEVRRWSRIETLGTVGEVYAYRWVYSDGTCSDWMFYR